MLFHFEPLCIFETTISCQQVLPSFTGDGIQCLAIHVLYSITFPRHPSPQQHFSVVRWGSWGSSLWGILSCPQARFVIWTLLQVLGVPQDPLQVACAFIALQRVLVLNPAILQVPFLGSYMRDLILLATGEELTFCLFVSRLSHLTFGWKLNYCRLYHDEWNNNQIMMK